MPVVEQTEARRKAAREYKARLKAAGTEAVTVRLGAEVRAKLDALAVQFGSKDAAIAALIEAAGEAGRKS